MTVYETLNHQQIRMWCEANSYWPGCVPGTPDRVRLGNVPFNEPEKLDLLDWDDWFKGFESRQLKFVYDPNSCWCELQTRKVRTD